MKLVKTARIELSVSGGEVLAADRLPEAGSVVILYVKGPDVSFRTLSEGDPIINRILNNPDILYTKYKDRVCYISKASVSGFIASLQDTYVAGVIIADESANIESVEAEAVHGVPPMFLCRQWYKRMLLPVLFFYLIILIANIIVQPSVRAKQEEIRKELAATEKKSRAESEATEKQEQMILAFRHSSSGNSATTFDKIAVCVPDKMRLSLLSLKDNVIRVKGEDSDITEVVLFADRLERHFRSARIVSIGKTPGKETPSFEITVLP